MVNGVCCQDKGFVSVNSRLFLSLFLFCCLAFLFSSSSRWLFRASRRETALLTEAYFFNDDNEMVMGQMRLDSCRLIDQS